MATIKDLEKYIDYSGQNYNGIVYTNHFNRYLCKEYYR